jgi:dTDP-4-dehydrorhamnose reductase
MLGHKLVQVLDHRFETWLTARSQSAVPANLIGDPRRIRYGIDVTAWETVEGVLNFTRPDVVVNAVGIVKQHPDAIQAIPSIEVNSLFPQRLATWCRRRSVRLIHISTDCVFAGTRGMYSEADPPDALDLYGRSKLLGEVGVPGCLTLRTSMVGRELRSSLGILEWFLSNEGGSVPGYTRAVFSGLPTGVLSILVADLIDNEPSLDGLYHVSTSPISKYQLLELFREAFGAKVDIVPADEPRIDRSLDSSAFRALTGFSTPSWPELVEAIASDPTPYEKWRAG